MPTRARRACLQPGCGGYAETLGRCAAHAAPIVQAREAARRTEAGRRWYYTARWRRLRLAVLRAEPLCRRCWTRDQRPVPATDVDHVEPHRGDPRRFWRLGNLQPLCAACHWEKTAEERGA